MKRFSLTRLAALVLGLAATAATLQSCDDDPSPVPESEYIVGLVTVRPGNGESVTLQLNDSTTIIPTNLSASPFGKKEVRALTQCSIVERLNALQWEAYIFTLDSIRTKLPVATAGADNDRMFGNDPVEIVRDWTTCAEDGYLTLRLRTRWGSSKNIHYVNLLTGTNKDNVYELELRHNAKGDTEGRMADALVAFDLRQLPKTDSGTATIRLTWLSYSGKKSAEFALRYRGKSEPTSSALQEATDDSLMQGVVQ